MSLAHLFRDGKAESRMIEVVFLLIYDKIGTGFRPVRIVDLGKVCGPSDVQGFCQHGITSFLANDKDKKRPEKRPSSLYLLTYALRTFLPLALLLLRTLRPFLVSILLRKP